MLKQLISLFAEKFLFNKKEWVGSQGLFSNSNPGTTFSVSSGQELISRHQPTVGLRLEETKHRLMSELGGRWESYALIRKDSLESLLQFVRGMLLAFTVKQQILNHLRQSSFQVKELHSVSLEGGAL